MSSLLFTYTANAYFFVGGSDERNKHLLYYRRHASSISQNLSIYSLIEIISDFNYSDILSYSPQIADEDSLVRDIFFESQDFKHSLYFEFVWAMFPTQLLV